MALDARPSPPPPLRVEELPYWGMTQGTRGQGSALEIKVDSQADAHADMALYLARGTARAMDAFTAHIEALERLARRLALVRRTYRLSAPVGANVTRELMQPADGTFQLEQLVLFTSPGATGSASVLLTGLPDDYAVDVIAGAAPVLPVHLPVTFPTVVRMQVSGSGSGYWTCYLQLARVSAD